MAGGRRTHRDLGISCAVPGLMTCYEEGALEDSGPSVAGWQAVISCRFTVSKATWRGIVEFVFTKHYSTFPKPGSTLSIEWSPAVREKVPA